MYVTFDWIFNCTWYLYQARSKYCFLSDKLYRKPTYFWFFRLAFKKIYPEVDKHLGRWNIDPYMQLACYEPNNFYNYIHCENGGDPKYINRVFAWMIFLNTIEKGGGTYFKYQNITAKPVAGDLYIWPAGWTHFHQGVKAPKEKKYILTGWYNYI